MTADRLYGVVRVSSEKKLPHIKELCQPLPFNHGRKPV